MKPKAFWLYAFFALACTIVVAGIALLVMHVAASETSEHAAYREKVRVYDAWYAERKLDPRQVRFDEVLAGRMPAESIEDASLRKLAADLRMLAVGESDVSARAKTLSAMFIAGDDDLGIRAWITCKNNERACVMRPTVATIGNPERLATLFGADEAAKRAALPEVPEAFRERPAWDGGAKRRWSLIERARGLPKLWLGLSLWSAVSCVFAAGFFLLGYAKHRAEQRDWQKETFYANPFGSIPHFLLGWIVYLAMLPGVLLMQASRIVGSDAQPMLNKLKHKVAGRTFASEHERILAQLKNLETRAAGRPDSDATIKLIRGAIKKVSDTQNLEELDKLRKVAEDIKLHYEVQEDLRETLA
ncbi:MAG: hypothetical protein AAB554_04970 [Patescibacteria group bacterium]